MYVKWQNIWINEKDQILVALDGNIETHPEYIGQMHLDK